MMDPTLSRPTLPLLRIPRSDKKPAGKPDAAGGNGGGGGAWSHPELYAHIHRLTQQFAHCKHALELSKQKRGEVKDHHYRLRNDLDAVQRDSLILSQNALRERKLRRSRRSPREDHPDDFDSVIDLEVHQQCAELHSIMRRQERAELGKLSKSEAQLFARVADVLDGISRACVEYLEKLTPELAKELEEMKLLVPEPEADDESEVSDSEEDASPQPHDEEEEEDEPQQEAAGETEPMSDDGGEPCETSANAAGAEVEAAASSSDMSLSSASSSSSESRSVPAAAGRARGGGGDSSAATVPSRQRKKKGPRPLGAGPILTEVNWLAHQHNTCAILAAKYRARASAHKADLCHAPLGGEHPHGGDDANGALAALVAQKAALTNALAAIRGASKLPPPSSTAFDFGSFASVLSSPDFSSRASGALTSQDARANSQTSVLESMLADLSHRITHTVATQQLVRRHKIGLTSKTEGGSPIAPPNLVMSPRELKIESESKYDVEDSAMSDQSSVRSSPKRKFSELLSASQASVELPPPPPPPLPPAIAMSALPPTQFTGLTPVRSLTDESKVYVPPPPPPPFGTPAPLGAVPFGKLEVPCPMPDTVLPPQPPKDGVLVDNCVYAVHSLSDVLCSFSDSSDDRDTSRDRKSPSGERRVVRIDVLQSFLERSKGRFRYLEVFKLRSTPNPLKHKVTFDSAESSNRPRKLARLSNSHTSVSSASTAGTLPFSPAAMPRGSSALTPATPLNPLVPEPLDPAHLNLTPGAPLPSAGVTSRLMSAAVEAKASADEGQRKRKRTSAAGTGTQPDISQMFRSSKRAAVTQTNLKSPVSVPIPEPLPVSAALTPTRAAPKATEVGSLLRSLRDSDPSAFLEVMSQFQTDARPGAPGSSDRKAAVGTSSSSSGPTTGLVCSPVQGVGEAATISRGERRTSRRRTSPRLAAGGSPTPSVTSTLPVHPPPSGASTVPARRHPPPSARRLMGTRLPSSALAPAAAL